MTPIDANPPVPPIPGDYACVTTPLPSTAPDPAQLKGAAIDLVAAGIPNVAVEVHAVATDAVLGQATTSALGPGGGYTINVATGGAAVRTYRKLSLANHVDSYGYDFRPAGQSNQLLATLVLTAAEIDAYYTAAGVVRDPALGTVWIDVSDCAPMYVTGATIDGPQGQVFYLDDDLHIDKTLTATKSGAVLILNAPPGATDFAVHAGPVMYRSWPIVVRAGALTQSDRLP